jgi:hypothetical protein
MLVGDLRSYDKPANVIEAEILGRRIRAQRDGQIESGFGLPDRDHRVGSWLDRMASLGLTVVLAIVLFLAVTALAQAGSTAAPLTAKDASMSRVTVIGGS